MTLASIKGWCISKGRTMEFSDELKSKKNRMTVMQTVKTILRIDV